MKLLEEWKTKYNTSNNEGDWKKQMEHFKKLYQDSEEEMLTLSSQKDDLSSRIEKLEKEVETKRNESSKLHTML